MWMRHSLSYQELCHISRAVGAALSQRIRPRQPVAIYMEKGCAALSAFFGVVYAGGFYPILTRNCLRRGCSRSNPCWVHPA